MFVICSGYQSVKKLVTTLSPKKVMQNIMTSDNDRYSDIPL